MTNREKYGDKLIELSVNGGVYALKNGIPALCDEIKCEECDFCNKSRRICKGSTYIFREWLNSEYKPKTDWSKVAVDTMILVKNGEEETWKKRYFAKYENGIVYAWECGATSWSAHRSYVNDWKMAKLAESED